MESHRPHILVIPYPAQGHMIPILDLTHHLAAARRLTITVVTTPMNLPLLSPLLSTFPSSIITPLVLPFPSAPGIPAGKENTKDLPPASFRQIMPALAKLQDPLLSWFKSHPSPPVAVLSDIFLGWTHRFALKVGIQRLVFSPSGAMALSVIYSLWKAMPDQGDRDENGYVSFKDVPNCPKYPWWQLSPVYRSYVKGDADSELIKNGFLDNMASWGLVINSFDDLEWVYLDHLMSGYYDGRVWAVGPLVSPNGLKDRGGSSSVESDKIISWLDTCQEDEVVYVSFGTQAVLTSQQKEVIAEALVKSGVRFIWVVRDHVSQQVSGDHEIVTHGFEDRLAGQGMIINGWVPQVLILKHPAVGAFLTHCGWNSTLEGIMSRVKLLAWPMGADQFSNATLLVDHLKVGVRVCEGSNMGPDPNELAKILKDSVKQDGDGKERIVKLHNSELEAISENGSSSNALVRLVNELCELKLKMPSNYSCNNRLD